VNCHTRDGETPLHAACTAGRVELARYLLQKGADVNRLNLRGESALHAAVRVKVAANSLALCRLLVESGADVFVCGQHGTPLALSIAHSNTQCSLLLKGVIQRLKKPSDSAYRIHFFAYSAPSYDNLNLPALLGIKRVRKHSGSIIAVQTPGANDIMVYNQSYKYELGNAPNTFDSSPLMDLIIDEDRSLFDLGSTDPEEVVHMVGAYMGPPYRSQAGKADSSPRASPIPEDIVLCPYHFSISVLKTPLQGKLRGILRTQSGDFRFFIPSSIFKGKTGKDLSGKDILKEMTKEIPELELKDVSKCVVVENSALHAELVKFEQSKIAQSARMKIGVLYVKQGQTTEEEVFGNEYGSVQFESFLELLGDIIELEGWQGFKGDLDVVHNQTGTHSLFTQFKGVDIMFHVSTLLPHSTEDEQQIAKKRCIGNDLTTIIFLEKGAVFKPPCVSGDFLQVFAAVQPAVATDGTPGFRVGFSRRASVPSFGPVVPKTAFLPAAGGYLRDFLLAKLVNGERACIQSEYMQSKMARTRRLFMDSLAEQYAPRIASRLQTIGDQSPRDSSSSHLSSSTPSISSSTSAPTSSSSSMPLLSSKPRSSPSPARASSLQSSGGSPSRSRTSYSDADLRDIISSKGTFSLRMLPLYRCEMRRGRGEAGGRCPSQFASPAFYVPSMSSKCCRELFSEFSLVLLRIHSSREQRKPLSLDVNPSVAGAPAFLTILHFPISIPCVPCRTVWCNTLHYGV